MKRINSIIIGTGSVIPEKVVRNSDFGVTTFYDASGAAIDLPHEEISEKFRSITGIEERRYATDDQVASDLGTIAAARAIEDAGIDGESLDHIIVAHNYGDIPFGSIQPDTVPSLASRIKHKLGIKNPGCVAYDILFGCPGWLQGMILAHAFIRSGIGKRIMVIGAETLSRITDPHDRDSMIYSDGAGACILEAQESEESKGILAHTSATFTEEEVQFIHFGKSYAPGHEHNINYIKMYGRKVYEFALSKVPTAMKECMDKAEISIYDLKKILIHQANEKLDTEVVRRFFRLYHLKDFPETIMPMIIQKMGNSSVATIPTLLDLIRRGELEGHTLNSGDSVIFASVGAGMNINAMVYRF